MDRKRQAASSAPAACSRRQGSADVVRREHRAASARQGASVITHPEKVLFPRGRARRSRRANWLRTTSRSRRSCVPHIRARPVTMERYPAGIGKKGFIQKDVSKGFPSWLERVEVPKKDGVVHHPLVDGHAVAALDRQPEHHYPARLVVARAGPLLSRISASSISIRPIDDADSLRAAALGLRDLLEKLGLPSWVKTSGSKGFHIVVPLDGTADYRRGRRGSRTPWCECSSSSRPITSRRSSARPTAARILVDTGRNGYSATLAAATRCAPSPARRCRRRARGRKSSAAPLARGPSRCRRCRQGWPRWVTCGRTCAAAAGRCGKRLQAVAKMRTS